MLRLPWRIPAFALIFVFPLPQIPQNDYRIVVKKSEFKLFLYRGEELKRFFPVAVGRNPGDKLQFGDFRTPEGSFSISQIQDSRSWVHDFKDGKGEIAGAYGPWFLRLRWRGDESSIARKWTSIGIHGTHDSASIGNMVTEGCIRLRNSELEGIARLVKVGTPVVILP